MDNEKNIDEQNDYNIDYNENNMDKKSNLIQEETTNKNIITEDKKFNPQSFNNNPISSGMSSNNNLFGPHFGHFNKGKVGIVFLIVVIIIAVIIGLVFLLK